MKAVIPFTFAGIEITKDSEGRISLTDLFKASGRDRNYNPNEWLGHGATEVLVETVAGMLNTGIDRIIFSKRGRHGGTFAHKQIALAYAKYLSPELHLTVNNVFFERIEEEKNPQLAVDRAIDSWKRKGKDEEWIDKRIKGISTRKKLTSVMASAGCTQEGFRLATNATYAPLFGGDASVVRKKLNAPEKANAREHMTDIQLATVELAELLSADNIKKKGIYGNNACVHECNKTSQLIASSVKQILKAAA